MKQVYFYLVLLLCFVFATAMPAEKGRIELSEIRQKRATCDLLSFEIKGTSLGSSACAAHCLTLKKKGGYCEKGVCRCRN